MWKHNFWHFTLTYNPNLAKVKLVEIGLLNIAIYGNLTISVQEHIINYRRGGATC